MCRPTVLPAVRCRVFVAGLAALLAFAPLASAAPKPGDEAPAFDPIHATGPHAGKTACPVCVYGTRTAIQIWTGESALDQAMALAGVADDIVGASPQGAVVSYVILVPEPGRSRAESIARLKAVESRSSKRTFLVAVGGPEDPALKDYRLTLAEVARPLVIVATNRRVRQVFSGLAADSGGRDRLAGAVREAIPTEEPYGEISVAIAPESEPGERLALFGRIFAENGQPIPRASVMAYHTNAKGLYNEPGANTRIAALRNVAVTDANGWYRFHTIRPAPYPGERMPAHIHLLVGAPGHHAMWIEVWFQGDKFIPAGHPARKHAGEGEIIIVPLAKDNESGLLKGRADVTLDSN